MQAAIDYFLYRGIMKTMKEIKELYETGEYDTIQLFRMQDKYISYVKFLDWLEEHAS